MHVFIFFLHSMSGTLLIVLLLIVTFWSCYKACGKDFYPCCWYSLAALNTFPIPWINKKNNQFIKAQSYFFGEKIGWENRCYEYLIEQFLFSQLYSGKKGLRIGISFMFLSYPHFCGWICVCKRKNLLPTTIIWEWVNHWLKTRLKIDEFVFHRLFTWTRTIIFGEMCRR